MRSLTFSLACLLACVSASAQGKGRVQTMAACRARQSITAHMDKLATFASAHGHGGIARAIEHDKVHLLAAFANAREQVKVYTAQGSTLYELAPGNRVSTTADSIRIVSRAGKDMPHTSVHSVEVSSTLSTGHTRIIERDTGRQHRTTLVSARGANGAVHETRHAATDEPAADLELPGADE